MADDMAIIGQAGSAMPTFTPLTSRIQTITLSLGRGALQDALYPRPTMLGGRLALLLFFSCAALLVQPCAATPFQWEFTGSLNIGREYHTATLLSDGRVLVAGGGVASGPQTYAYPYTRTAELYDPATGTWTFTGDLNNVRSLHTATLLPNGKVLVAGGWPEAVSTGSAELYDPATGTWTLTGSLNVRHAAHTATLLFDGRVLVAGGTHSFTSVELYDPATGTWTVTGSLTTPRYGYHTATLLSDGRVLVAGGRADVASVELYDPATGTWTVTGSLNTGRSDHTATLLANGTVLVAGGENQDMGALASAELYDPGTGNWTPTGSLNVRRWDHTATLLSDGRVLVAGGQSAGSALAGAEIYDPATGTWTVTGDLNTARGLHKATLLSDGRVLAVGGWAFPGFIASAELFNSGVTPTPTPTATATPTATPGPIELTGQGKKVGGINTSRLKWRGATSANVDVYRDGNVIATTPNNGLYDDSTGTTGHASFMYQVCEAGTQTCSNTVTVNFGP
jgi:galactose oxidase-like protein/Kelch motif protein